MPFGCWRYRPEGLPRSASGWLTLSVSAIRTHGMKWTALRCPSFPCFDIPIDVRFQHHGVAFPERHGPNRSPTNRLVDCLTGHVCPNSTLRNWLPIISTNDVVIGHGGASSALLTPSVNPLIRH